MISPQNKQQISQRCFNDKVILFRIGVPTSEETKTGINVSDTVASHEALNN